MKVLFLLASIFYICRSAPDGGGYDGFKVFRLKPTTKDQNTFLENLFDQDFSLDFWAEPNSAGIPVDVMVPPYEQDDFVRRMHDHGLEVEVFINDIQKKINEEKVQSLSRGSMTWTSYHRLENIYSWMDGLPKQYPGKVTVLKAGTTYEDRVIKGLKISFGEGRRAVFLEGGMHAREWISPATVTYLANELLTSKNPDFRQVAESFDWYIVPVSNPDGYVFTHLINRLWRKTRTDYTFFCKGADPNRNWDIHWGEEGSSNRVCSDVYAGPNAFSERETRSLSRFISTIADKLDVYLAFHSYSQLLLMPYGHTEEHLDNYGDVLTIGLKAAEGLAVKYGTKYKVGNIAETIYKASGSSMDWVKSKHKVPISFTYELRDTGKHGFLLPAEQIIPNCEEVTDSIIAMFKESARLKYFTLKDTKKKKPKKSFYYF